jgi:glutamate-5-semialdehyde dehydrogenase
VNPNAVQLVNTPDRSLMSFLLQQNQSIDLVIPRGGENLIKAVVEQSRIPVIKHFNGICHIFVDKSLIFKNSSYFNQCQNAKNWRLHAMETMLNPKT